MDGSLRADARANRDRILMVARAAFADDPNASLSSVARAAGVGQGTFYRHFSNREALVLGVYRKEVDGLVDLAPALLAEHAPLQAFSRWCEQLAQMGRVKRAIADVLHAVISDQDFQETYWPMVGAVRCLMDACKASGDMLPSADPEDFLLLAQFLWMAPPGAGGEAQQARVLALLFRGLGVRDDKLDA